MKQYLLLLRSSDFNKSNNIWTTDPINIYNNDSYKNYSYVRSLYGLDLIGDTTFVGTEVTSPSYSMSTATPTDENAVYVTDYGEVVYDSATPSLLRFIDTTSRVDILSYKHAFTNISGTFQPTFNLQVYESDTGDVNGPWLKSATAIDSNVLFIRKVKKYIKLELEIYAPEIDLNTLGLVFYLEIGIHHPNSPVISDASKNILRRFPSWTAIYEDSINAATPELQIPQSTAGKFISSLVQESLDNFQGEIDELSINSYINSADIDMLSWVYSTKDILSNIVSITGDGVQLAKAEGSVDFFNCRQTDYIYYYNPVTKEILTTRLFGEFLINDSPHDQDAKLLFNDFDEFGARVSLPRLYLESNENYKKRILDVTANLPEITMDGFKRTLRRELDIWRAYGATPDSDYIGATPEVLEISDIESSTEYFDYSGKPLPAFEKLVEDINSKYPSNLGYVKWGEGVWDYAGILNEGVGRIPAIYDPPQTTIAAGDSIDVFAGFSDSGDLLTSDLNFYYNSAKITAIAIDNTGGAYISGRFDTIDGKSRSNLAYINSSGGLGSWAPSAGGEVYGLAISGDNIYISGAFTSINGVDREYLAAVNTSGSLLDFNFDFDGGYGIFSIVTSGDNIYIGGEFTSINGNVRNYVAGVNTSGNVLSWNPNANARITDIAILGDNIYLGGWFSVIGTQSRNRLAALNTSGSLLAWNPNVNAEVETISILGSNIYFGGRFTGVNGNARNYLAAVNMSGNLLTWNPNVNSNYPDTYVYDVATLGDNIYVGGLFNSIGGTEKKFLAAVNTSGSLLDWNVNVGSSISRLGIFGNNIYIGFDQASTLNNQEHVLAISNTNGNVYSSNLNIYSSYLGVYIDAVAPDSNGGYYVGGLFSHVSGQNRNRLAYINSSGGLGSWNPSSDGEIYALAISGDNIYIGGYFTNINENTRYKLAAVNTSGNVLAWNPSSDGTVYKLLIKNENIYIGGAFTSINGNARNYLAAVNTSGNVLSWNPNANGVVQAIDHIGSNIYVGGQFTEINGNARSCLAAINTSGNVLAFDVNVYFSYVRSMAIIGDNIYFGGFFSAVNEELREHLAAVNTSGNLLDWSPNADESINDIKISGSNIYIGGYFTNVSGKPRNGFAVLNTSGNVLDLNLSFNIFSWVSGIDVNGSNIFVGGGGFGYTEYESVSILSENYQGGVGDFNDAKLLVQQLEEATVSFDGTIKISGVKKVGEEDFYTPIDIHYSWYLSYLQKVNDYNAGRRVEGIEEDVGVAVVYEIEMPPHDNYATPSTFYANLNYLERDDFFVGNRYSQNHSAYPEFNYIKVVDQEGNTLNDIEFRSKEFDEIYLNTEATPYSKSINIYKANSVSVFFNVRWESSSNTYVEVDVAPFRLKFDDDALSYSINPITFDSIQIATPDVNNYSANLKIGSTVYSQISEIYNSSQANSVVRINDLNDPTITGINSKNIDIQDLLDTIIYPVGATPQSLYVNAQYYEDYTLFSADELISARGGLSDNIIDEITYLVPSSPNLIWTLRKKSNDQIINAATYFESATISNLATPMYFEVDSAMSSYYPFKKPYYEQFTAETTPEFFYGFIDEINNTYKEASEIENYYINQDKYLDSFLIDKSSFGLNENTEYIVSSVEISTTPQFVRAYFSDPDIVLKNVSDAIKENEKATVDIYAERDELTDAYYLTGLHSGWVYVDEKEYYIYSKPVTETYNGQYFDIQLQNVPRIGAPILVKVGSKEYRNLVFEDAATPGKASFINAESVTGNKNNTLYLAYEDLSEIQVKDTYTGNIIFSDLSTSTNQISPFDQATPAIYRREYEVTYKVNDAFYVDKDVYFEEADDYRAVLYFSATPSVNSNYTITYEKDSINNFMSIDLNIDQADNPLNEGYVYISKDEYGFNDIKTTLSPTFIGDSYDDYMSLSIISYDTNGNLKPGQTFRIHGNYIAATPEYVTTNDNGFGVSIIKYDGPRPSNVKYDSINIDGIGSATPNGSFNSLTGGFNLEIPFKIRRSNEFNANLKAAPIRYRIPADGTTDVPIVGRVYWKDQPFEAEVNLKWNKAETLKDLFNLEEFNYVTTDSQGKFLIQNQITAQNSLNPSGWFVRIEIADEEEFFDQLEAAGEVLSPLDVTISGDIVYWYEEYDNIHYANEQLPMGTRFGYSIQENSDYLASPTFRYDHPTSSSTLIYPSTTPFHIPRWVNLRRYDQYQMGILGSTIDDIDNYDNIHPDFGDT